MDSLRPVGVAAGKRVAGVPLASGLFPLWPQMTRLSSKEPNLLCYVCWGVIPTPLSLTPVTSSPGPAKAVRLSPRSCWGPCAVTL